MPRPSGGQASKRTFGRPPFAAAELGWLLLIPAVALLAVGIEWMAEPLSGIYFDRGYDFFQYLHEVLVRPEPEETVAFVIAVIVPILVAITVLLFGGPGRATPALTWPIAIVQLGLVAFICWAAWKQRQVNALSFLGAFEKGLLPAGYLLAAPVIGLGLTLIAISWDGVRMAPVRRAAERLRAAPAWPAAVLAALATLFWLLPGVITDEGVSTSGLIPFAHIPIEFDEYVAASNGRTPLVDYVPWYGSLLPIALAWWWPLFDLSITSFTATMVVVTGLALLAVFGAFRRLTGNAWAALALYLPFIALALFPWDTEGAVREYNGSYFAILPARYLGPFVLVWLCARHLRGAWPPLWALFGIAGLAAFNNPEFGTPALLGLIAAMLLGAERGDDTRGRLRRAGAEAAAGFLGAIALACAVILIRSGELPNPELFGYVARVTSRGYGLATMPDWGLHWVLYVTYAAALVTAAVRHAGRSPDGALTGLLAFAGIFGLLTGAYFAGRSLPWQLWGLFPAWALALSLLGLAAWRSLRTADRGGLARVAVGAFAALSGVGLMAAGVVRFPLPGQQIDRIGADGVAVYDKAAEQRFVEERTEPSDRVVLIGPGLEYRLAERAGVENVSPWFSFISVFGPSEAGRALDQLEQESGESVFLLIDPDPTYRTDLLQRELGAILRQRGYARIGRDPASDAVQWRLVSPS